jgi:hypothetical protein
VEALSNQCREIFEEQSITVSTFGIGQDVNGELLQAMADGGGGMYEFVTPRRIEELTRKAMSGLAKLMGTRGTLTASLLVNGMTVVRPESTEGNDVLFQIGDVRQGNVHKMPFALDIPPSVQRQLMELAVLREDGTRAPVHLAHLTFTCQPIDNPLHLFQLETDLYVDLAGPDEDTSSLPRDPCVLVSFTLLEVGDMNDRAVEMMQEGTQESIQGAVQQLREGVASMEAVEGLDDQGFVTTALRRARRTLERLSVRGRTDAARVALELQMQTMQMDRQSGYGYQASEDGRLHSEIGDPAPYSGGGAVDFDAYARGMVTPPISPHLVGGFDWVDQHSDDDALPPPRYRNQSPPRRTSSPTLRSSVPLNPIDIPVVLRTAVVSDGSGVPPEFFCSITGDIMNDPVMTCDGHTYQRSAIQQWFDDGNFTSPLTGEALPDLSLLPNMVLRSMISNWK